MKLRIGHLSTFYHTAIILMAEGTVSRALGMDVEWRLFGTGPAIVNAFEKKELDLAYIGLPPAVVGISRGVGIVCIAGGHLEGTVIAGAQEFAGFPEQEDLRTILGQFRTKKIGVPGKGSIHDVILSECLERYGLTHEIAVVNYSWADQVTEAMVKGEVSAAVGTPALLVAIRRFAHGKILYPPSKLWPNNPSYGIAVDRGFHEREKDALQRFLVLHEEATSLMRNKPHLAAQIISEYVGFVDSEFVLETLKVSPKYCALITDGFIASTMEFVKTLRKLGYIEREIDSHEIFDTSLINRIHPARDHYGDGIRDIPS
ncbi:MAG TPA: ABC transporter substrate-binding protein [Thermodesulfovibrionales bacterium]|nr:ABC transporter substrate-binding protein [Thermodesulfovibrionales bacterium]